MANVNEVEGRSKCSRPQHTFASKIERLFEEAQGLTLAEIQQADPAVEKLYHFVHAHRDCTHACCMLSCFDIRTAADAFCCVSR